MFYTNNRYIVTQRAVPMTIEDPSPPSPPPTPKQPTKGKGLEKLIDKLKTVTLLEKNEDKKRKRITF